MKTYVLTYQAQMSLLWEFQNVCCGRGDFFDLKISESCVYFVLFVLKTGQPKKSRNGKAKQQTSSLSRFTVCKIKSALLQKKATFYPGAACKELQFEGGYAPKIICYPSLNYTIQQNDFGKPSWIHMLCQESVRINHLQEILWKGFGSDIVAKM